MPHASPLAVIQQRALALRGAGNLAAARDLLTDAVESARPPFGKDHPDVLSTAHLLARLHREADDPSAARRILEEAFAAGERRWPHADPLMLALSYELGSVADELGNRHEARRNYTRVAAAGPAVLGADHPAVRTAREYLGDAAPAPQPPVPPTAPPEPAGQPHHGALVEPTVSLAVLSTAWKPHDASTAAPIRPAVSPASGPPAGPSAPGVPPAPAPPATHAAPSAPAIPAVPPPGIPPAPPGVPPPALPPSVVPPAPTLPPPVVPPAPALPPRPPVVPPPPSVPPPASVVPPPPVVPQARTAYHDQAAPAMPLGEQVPMAPPVSSAPATPVARPTHEPSVTPHAVPYGPAPGSPAPHASAGVVPDQRGSEEETGVIALPPAPGIGTAPGGGGTEQPADPGWARPTIRVQQIGPLLAEEAARAARQTQDPAAGSAATLPVSAPPISGPPVNAPPVSGPPAFSPVSVPPAPGQPISAPPISAPPVSAPPISAPPVSAPPISAPPVGTPPVGTPPGPAYHPPLPGVPGYPAAPATPAAGPDALTTRLPQQEPFGGPPHGSAQQLAPTPPAYAPPPVSGAAPSAYPAPPGWGQLAPPTVAAPYQGPLVLPEPEPSRSRTAIVVALISVLVAVAAVVGVGLLLLDRRAAPPDTTPGSTATESGAPPTDLTLRDDATTITLTWTDPSGGLVPFVVAGGRAGVPLRMMATVGAGQSTYTVNGLSSRVDYCFTVLAVYDTDQLATSSQVCTSREGGSTPG